MRVPDDRDASGVPVMCIKCNAVFRSDSVDVSHYAQEHEYD